MTVAKLDHFAPLSTPMARAACLGLMAIIILLGIYHATLMAMVDIWIRSETYAHCFLIFPISGYLIWQRKAILLSLMPTPDYRALVVLALVGFVWLIASLAEIAVLQQFALVSMIPILLWTILGWNVVSQIAFPLGFLVFSVPFGEFLVPRLINFTADFTVGMLKLTGIPVYRDGVYFSIPSGDWSVVDACSGLRYLIASITLGCLFAYINYTSLKRRLIFTGIACIVPIIANGLRAYMIVLIGHFSNMKLAVGVDHFIYGWVFFGLVMALLFWIGAKWAEEMPAFDGLKLENGPSTNLGGERALLVAAGLALALSVLWPMRANSISENNFAHAPTAFPPIATAPTWHAVDFAATLDWAPSYVGTTGEHKAAYSDGKHTVVVFIEYYQTQAQGRELVSSQNFLLASKAYPNWKSPGETWTDVQLRGQQSTVWEGSVKSVQQEFITWRWYWIDGKHIANDWLAKLLEVKAKLLKGKSVEAGIIVAVKLEQDSASAKAALQDFVDTMLPGIEASLNTLAEVSVP